MWTSWSWGTDPAAYWALRHALETAPGYPLDLYTETDDAVFVAKLRERGQVIYERQA
jgi:hypothetical protein